MHMLTHTRGVSSDLKQGEEKEGSKRGVRINGLQRPLGSWGVINVGSYLC